MKANGNTVEEILHNLPIDREKPFKKLHEIILTNLPKGFKAEISMGGWDMLYLIVFILLVIIANLLNPFLLLV